MAYNAVTFHNAASATANGVATAVEEYSILGVQITGTFVATVTFEGTIDGTNYVAIEAINVATGAKATTATAAGVYRMGVVGFVTVRARLAWTSGTSITVTGHLSTAADPLLYDGDLSDNLDRLLGKITNYDVLANGTLGVAEATVSLACSGLSTVGLGISGTWVGTIVAETTAGDSVWDAIPLVDNTMGSAGLTTTVNGNFVLGVAGALTLRIRMSAWTSGTATVYLEGTSAAAGVFMTRSLPTGTNNIGDVDVASITAGETHIGEVGCNTEVVSVTPTITAGAYTAGDVVGGIQTIAAASRVSGEPAILQSIVIDDLSAATQAFTIWFFNANPTNGTYTDNIALDIHDTDLAMCIGHVKITSSDYASAADNSVACKVPIGLPLKPAATSLFAIAQCTGTAPTYVSTADLTFRYSWLRD